MAWMETDCSKHTYIRWKVKWRLQHLGALGTMGGTAPFNEPSHPQLVLIVKKEANEQFISSVKVPLKS